MCCFNHSGVEKVERKVFCAIFGLLEHHHRPHHICGFSSIFLSNSLITVRVMTILQSPCSLQE
jgi:hypothetical protein